MKYLLSLNILIIISLFGFIRCIIFGKIVPIKEYPYQVSVYKNGKHTCGGVIIDKATILTAAHCISRFNDPSIYSVRAGSSVHSEGKEHFLTNVIIHKDYNKTTNLDLDIAILKLSSESKLKLDSNIQSIVLQEKDVLISGKCNVSGWGTTEMNVISTELKATEVSIITNEECSKYFNDITTHKICARTLKCPKSSIISHVYFGDSGGPLVCNDKLVGIVSGVNSCKIFDCPGVYTRISKLYDWIIENNKQNYCSVNNTNKE